MVESVSGLKTLWERAPWTLRFYVAAGVLVALVVAPVHWTALQWILIGLTLAVDYFLLRGVRWVWFVAIGGTAIYFVGFLLVLGTNAIVNLLALVLLVAPPTRQYFARDG